MTCEDGSARNCTRRALNHIFGCGLTLAGTLGRPYVDDEVVRRIYDVIEEINLASAAIRCSRFTTFVADRDA